MLSIKPDLQTLSGQFWPLLQGYIGREIILNSGLNVLAWLSLNDEHSLKLSQSLDWLSNYEEPLSE